MALTSIGVENLDKCICKICECGQHRCPHKVKTSTEWNTHSEYRSQYIPLSMAPPQPVHPMENISLSNALLSNRTTNREDFVEHKVEPPKPTPPEVYKPPVTEVQKDSNYRRDFVPKSVEPLKPFYPCANLMPEGDFIGQPTYRQDFRPHHIQPNKIVTPENRWEPPEQHWSPQPTYRTDYVAHHEPPATPIIPQVEKPALKPFQDSTEHRNNFVQHPIKPPVMPSKEKWYPPTLPMNTTTTNRSDFSAKNAVPMDVFLPQGNLGFSHEPLENMTTNRADYMEHEVHCPDKPPQYTWHPPSDKLESFTTYRSAYLPHKCEPVEPMQPKPTLLQTGRFDDRTSYRDNFTEKEATVVKPRPKEEWKPPSEPMQDRTTNRDSFVPHRVEPAKPIMPPERVLNEAQLDSHTTYRTNYIEHRPRRCPAASLGETKSYVSPFGYVFNGENEAGHKVYNQEPRK